MFMSISIQAIVTQTTMTPTVAQRLMTSTRRSSCSSLRCEWKRGRDRPPVEVVRNDLRRGHDEPVRRRHDRRQDADADERRQPGREELDEQRRERLVRGRALFVQAAAQHRPGQGAAQAEHAQGDAEDGSEAQEGETRLARLERPDLVADVRQQSERNVGQQHRQLRPPGVVERRRTVDPADLVRVLPADVRDYRAETAVQAGAEEEQEDDQHADQQHQEALDAVGEDVRVGAAQGTRRSSARPP